MCKLRESSSERRIDVHDYKGGYEIEKKLCEVDKHGNVENGSQIKFTQWHKQSPRKKTCLQKE